MTSSDVAFSNLVENALEASLRHFAEAHPQRVLSGLALGTDDDLTTLFVALADREFYSNPPYPGAEFIFVEWPFGDDSGAFEDSQKEISCRFHATEVAGYDAHIENHVNSTFACLVEALKKIRAKSLVSDNVLFVIGSTDPSDHSMQLYLRAAEALNGDELFAKFRSAQ